MINIMFISYICIHLYTVLGEKSGIRAKMNTEKNITILVCHTMQHSNQSAQKLRLAKSLHGDPSVNRDF